MKIRVIQTGRCKLNAVKADDLDDVVKLRTSAAVRQFLGGPVERNLVESRFSNMLKPDVSALRWAIRSKANRSFIGLVTLDKHRDGEDTEISFELLPEWWGQGYATEAVRAVIDYALKDLELSRVIAETQAANIASRCLLERLGMHPEKTVMRFGAKQIIYSTRNSEDKDNGIRLMER